MTRPSFVDYYSDHADKLDTYWHDFISVQADWLLNRLKILYKPDATFSVMDLGCGTGAMLSRIAEFFPNAEINGVDGTSLMVKASQNKLGDRGNIKEVNLTNYIFDKEYDVIISTTVLHHLESPSDHLDLIHTGLKVDGHCFVSEFALNTLRLHAAHFWWSMTQKSHKQAWTENDFRYLLEGSGYKIVNGAILSPDSFWRIQMYHLQSDITD